ncbi:MAG: thioesterase family protein [Bacteroidales bacterium]|nr:thioesterase family protein [Bacteroidales bacterium]MBQ7984947.1 thioesterase family protein [Bacteroidales bacterium]
MEITIPQGVKGVQTHIVADNDTATAFLSGEAEVLATPKLLALMEEVSSKSVKPYLPEGYISVGVEMHVYHLKSSKVGDKVQLESTFVKQDGRKLFFNVIATSNGEKIGEGECNRFIVNKAKFENK